MINHKSEHETAIPQGLYIGLALIVFAAVFDDHEFNFFDAVFLVGIGFTAGAAYQEIRCMSESALQSKFYRDMKKRDENEKQQKRERQ